MKICDRSGSRERWRHIIKETGYFEGRVLPTPFDQDYYCRKYKDVFNAIRAKKLGSAIQHYYDQGIDEFRAPSRLGAADRRMGKGIGNGRKGAFGLGCPVQP